MFKRINSSRTMQRCVPGNVQSRRPLVPSAQPSQTPSERMRQANGSWSRFSHATLSHLAVVVRLLRAESKERHVAPFIDTAYTSPQHVQKAQTGADQRRNDGVPRATRRVRAAREP